MYLVSNRDGEHARLRYVNLFTAEKNDISGRGDGDVEQFALSKDGHYLAYVTDEGGADKLNLLDLRLASGPRPAPLAGWRASWIP